MLKTNLSHEVVQPKNAMIIGNWTQNAGVKAQNQYHWVITDLHQSYTLKYYKAIRYCIGCLSIRFDFQTPLYMEYEWVPLENKSTLHCFASKHKQRKPSVQATLDQQIVFLCNILTCIDYYIYLFLLFTGVGFTA